jgi:hypothetical protein
LTVSRAIVKKTIAAPMRIPRYRDVREKREVSRKSTLFLTPGHGGDLLPGRGAPGGIPCIARG